MKLYEKEVIIPKEITQSIVEKKKLESGETFFDRLQRASTFWICLTVLISVILICGTILMATRYEIRNGSRVDKITGTISKITPKK